MKQSHELRYQTIQKYVLGLVRSGKLKAGDRLPSEIELAKKFGSSRIPVRQAMQGLVDQGLVQRVHGRGAFLKRAGGPTADTNRIAVLFCHSSEGFFNSPFYATIFSGIQLEAHIAHKVLVIQSLPIEEGTNPVRCFHELLNDVDGFIVVDLLAEVYARVEKGIKKLAKPVVIVNYETLDNDFDSIVFDSYENAKQMVDFLFRLGHRRIGYVLRRALAQVEHPNIARRHKGYLDGLTAHDLPFDPQLVRELPEFVDEPAALKKMLTGRDRPTALFCCDDEVALRTIEIIRESGLSVPQDVTVVGYDNHRDALRAVPPLTTMHTPLVEMGNRAIKRVLEKQKELATGISTRYRIVLPGSITPRQSHRSL
jgi:GntR family transcriptional regulator of arabinose operon